MKSLANKLQIIRYKCFNEREKDYAFLQNGEAQLEAAANHFINKKHVWSPAVHVDGGKKRMKLKAIEPELAVNDDLFNENASLTEVEQALRDGVCRAAIEIATKGPEFRFIIRKVVVARTGQILSNFYTCINCDIVLENSGNGTANLNRHFIKCDAKNGGTSTN